MHKREKVLRPPLAAILFLVASSSVSSQTGGSIALPGVGVKDAGTYHLATGTWNRGDRLAGGLQNIIFDNRCSVGTYYAGLFSTHRAVDDGRIPSTSSPTNPGPPYSAISWTGTRDEYTVSAFEIGYCTYDASPNIEVNFWTCFSGCQDATMLTPIATFALANMPGSGGGLACWTVEIDLDNSGLYFDLKGDCDGAWDGGGPADTFGWSWQQTSPSTGGYPGPLIAGDPAGYLGGGPGSSGCEFGANTIFYAGNSPTVEGTGLDGTDLWEKDFMTPPPAYGGCLNFGGYSSTSFYASFHLAIESAPTGPGFPYCPGDGTGSPCPAVNNNDGSMGGCDWGDPAFPGGGVLDATGDPAWTHADVTLIATGVANNFGIFFGANNAVNGGAGSPLNGGLRCAGGGVVRLTPPTVASGHTASHGPIELLDPSAGPGVTRRYQYWFRTPGGPGGTMANLTNGYEIAWQ